MQTNKSLERFFIVRLKQKEIVNQKIKLTNYLQVFCLVNRRWSASIKLKMHILNN